jgi:hypothetical protein
VFCWVSRRHHVRAAVSGIQANKIIANPNTYLLNNVEDTRWWGSQMADEASENKPLLSLQVS